MIRFGTFKPSVPGCTTWREAAIKPLRVFGMTVSYEVAYIYESIVVTVHAGPRVLGALTFEEAATDNSIREWVYQLCAEYN